MNAIRTRVLHLIRHAESEFNVLANHQIEGFVPIVKKLDADLTPEGFAQAHRLRESIAHDVVNGYPPEHPLAPRNAQIVITSPLSRAILTAAYSLPFRQYRYVIRPEISEQVENTTDIPVSKEELKQKFPDLDSQISALPDCWWYRHPKYRQTDAAMFGPQHDAELLHSFNGEEPAAESKQSVRRRVQWFFKWLYTEPQLQYDNIAVVSHSCTIYEMERYLRGIPEHVQHAEQLSMTKNTEVRSFELMENLIVLPSEYSQHEPHLWRNFDGYYTPSASAYY